MSDIAYRADASFMSEDGLYKVVAAERDKPGHWTINEWERPEDASNYARELNKRAGHTDVEATLIFVSSLNAGRQKALYPLADDPFRQIDRDSETDA